ncbi:MAG: DUF362 domain-containing protein [Gemmatimonadaceae bacterium]|nr:DUF362 domain-containing protein [Gemmatimonadaceae bacterium]
MIAPRSLPPDLVGVARAPEARYGRTRAIEAPELPGGIADDVALITFRALLLDLGLDAERAGTAQWNPLGALIAPGARVVVKPNWVLHENQGGHGLDPLLTHTSVLDAVLAYLALAAPARVIVGDAPVQGCRFDLLRVSMGIDALIDRHRARGLPVEARDFRRTVLLGRHGDPQVATSRGDDDYVLYDLGTESVLEPITRREGEFRVTMYDPDRLARTHAPGRHQFLVAREVIDADVVVNVPKLKTHMKAGVTGALKNLVGINGLKDYLPHHRKGGAAGGGDCYAGASRLKAAAEDLLDAANRTERLGVRKALGLAARACNAADALVTGDRNLEGAWHGNDTVWRMCLDLQQLLRYGRADGTIADTPQRQVLSLTDAIIAGDGNGPLANAAAPLGVLTFAANPASAEWVNTWLLGLDPRRIPIVREAFGPVPRPIADCAPEAVRARVDGEDVAPETLVGRFGPTVRLPAGWVGQCEAVDRPAAASGRP